MNGLPEKIVSGSQTGTDRAALHWAIAHGVPHGGWCPKRRRAEDRPLDGRYQSKEARGAAAQTTQATCPAFRRRQFQPPLLFLAQRS